MAFPGAIHRYTISRTTSASPIVDSEGRAQYVEGSTVEEVVVGRVCILSSKERANLGEDAQDVDVSVLCPLGVDVEDGDYVIDVTKRNGGAVAPQLAGPWKVVAVRWTEHHLRLLSKRHGE